MGDFGLWRDQTDPRRGSNCADVPFRRTTAGSAWVLIITGCVVFFGGWLFDVTALKNVIPGTVVMKASTAAALVTIGISLLLLHDPDAARPRRIAGRVCALSVVAVGLAFLSEFTLGWNLGIDEFPFRDDVGHAQGIAFPGRLAPTTAVSLVLVGCALLALNVRVRGWNVAELFAVPVAAVSSMSLIGYSYSIPAFYGPSSAAKMALTTGMCFMVVALGIIVARPNGHLLTLARTTAAGSLMARRLLPYVVLGPIILGWLRLEASDAGVFDDRVGTWCLTAATIGGLLLVLWRTAVRVNTADSVRRELERRLYELANFDQMTGLFNRHRFDEELAQHMALTRRHGGSSTLVMIDLDRLKHVNDSLGHAAGDFLITATSRVIEDRVRGTDIAGRLGGDEFCILLLKSTPAGAMELAEDLLAAIRAAKPSAAAADAWSTVSIGVAHHADQDEHDDGTALLAAADAAMYDAKRTGGDRVSTYCEPGRRSNDQALSVSLVGHS